MFENKIQSVNKNNTYNFNDDFSSKIESLSQSVPEVTTTKKDKELAVKIKKEIINLYQQQLMQAKQTGNSQQVSSITDKINVLNGEINTISDEINDMTSIFDKK